MTGRPVFVANPLPAALRRYSDALADNIRAAGVEVVDLNLRSMEIGTAGRRERLRSLVLSLADRLRVVGRSPGVIICVWPGFGLLEPAMWALASTRHQVAIVYHDPVPIRKQFGYSWVSRIAFRICVRFFKKIRILAHSELAQVDIQREFGVESTFVPHPFRMSRSETSVTAERPVVTVLGQFKPERTLEPPNQIASGNAGKDFELRIVGRGWPSVEGWSVEDRFVSEEEFSVCISESACVVIPYERFYQSGVAARCLEHRTPVLAPRHENIAWLFGPAWPGLVGDDDDWSAKLTEVVRLDPDLEGRARRLELDVVAGWRDFLGRPTESRGDV